ncbi:hypothetical protein [Leifsonia poae]|uniref:hypothetical protein n=1 Tax=Leifsonia poae TaxID=110933 RepID=UPI001CBF8AC8|nr:hypothetical protein [Leifsonia poae]
MFRFELTVQKLNVYGDRVDSTSAASILADNLSEAVTKGRVAHSATYDDFRKFWSHSFSLVSVTEADPMPATPDHLIGGRQEDPDTEIANPAGSV